MTTLSRQGVNFINRNLRLLTSITSIGMFLVLLAGALVTKTGSGRGCGTDWPLCNGKFIPAYTIESLIEYSHRALSGMVGILVLLTVIAIWNTMREHSEALIFALSSLFFTVLQAILGALAVVWEQSSAVMALHFGFSLLAFASTLLLVITVWRRHKSREVTLTKQLTKSFRNRVWMVSTYAYIVVYIGAFVRHTDSGGACQGWPLCNGQLLPELEGGVTIAFFHRMAAALLFVLIVSLAFTANRAYRYNAEIRQGTMWAVGLTLMQVFSGALVVKTMGSEDLYLFASLLHTVLVSALFGILCYLCVASYRYSKL